MAKYNKYLIESNNYAESMAEEVIEKMEDLLADWEMFLDEKIAGSQSRGVQDITTVKKLKAQFYKSFKQWDSMKKDLEIFSKKIDNLK